MRTAVIRQRIVAACIKHNGAAILFHAHRPPAFKLSFASIARIHRRPSALLHRGFLQAVRAPHDGVELINRHFAHAFDAHSSMAPRRNVNRTLALCRDSA